MVCFRREGEANLSDDLRPHVERGVGLLPGVERERRPTVGQVAHDGFWRFDFFGHAGAPVRGRGSRERAEDTTVGSALRSADGIWETNARKSKRVIEFRVATKGSDGRVTRNS